VGQSGSVGCAGAPHAPRGPLVAANPSAVEEVAILWLAYGTSAAKVSLSGKWESIGVPVGRNTDRTPGGLAGSRRQGEKSTQIE
jgi:hypothetical protein